MVNTAEFTKRLHRIMEYYDLSAASFADKIDVGRSSISHLLSGRNNPSLDFVLKIIKAFPEVELYWLLNGRGTFPKKDSLEEAVPSKRENIPPASAEKKPEVRDLPGSTAGDIQKIVIFYKNGRFEVFEN